MTMATSFRFRRDSIESSDIRYSQDLDSEGNALTEAQAEFFKDSKIRDEGGNLLRVYHGTTERFTVFDRTKGRSFADIQGMFFSPWEIDAGGYGDNVQAYYLNIKNPAPESLGYKEMFQDQNDRGVKAREYLVRLGYDGVNNGNEEYIAFEPNQIKLASNTNPTEDVDIRYSEYFGDEFENNQVKEYNNYDKALSRDQWARFYEEADYLASINSLDEAGNIFIAPKSKAGKNTIVVYDFDESRKQYNVVLAVRQASEIDDSFSKIREMYQNGDRLEQINREIGNFLQSGRLQRYNPSTGYYLAGSSSARTKRGASEPYSRYYGSEAAGNGIQEKSGSNDGIDGDIRFSSDLAPVFYSRLEREIDAFKGDKIGAASIVPYLKGKGVKAEEIKWSGIEQFLEGKKSVTKQELKEFLAGTTLQIEEDFQRS